MLKYTIAHDYVDADDKPLRLFGRFVRRGGASKLVHVGSRENATPFLTRQEAEASCPKGYHVEPKARAKAKKDVLGRGRKRASDN